jgi:hypothetical protein
MGMKLPIHFLQHGGRAVLPTSPESEPGSAGLGGDRSVGAGTARHPWSRGSGLFPLLVPAPGQVVNSQRGPLRETEVPSGQSLASILQVGGRSGPLSAARAGERKATTAAGQMLATKIANTTVIDFMRYLVSAKLRAMPSYDTMPHIS